MFMILAEHLIGLQTDIKGFFNFVTIQKLQLILFPNQPFLKPKWITLRIHTLRLSAQYYWTLKRMPNNLRSRYYEKYSFKGVLIDFNYVLDRF